MSIKLMKKILSSPMQNSSQNKDNILLSKLYLMIIAR